MPLKIKKLSREYLELLTETLIYVFFVMTFLVQSFVIPTGSMKDNILIGDHIFVDKVSYSQSLGSWDRFLLPQSKIERGMIVTFKAPAEINKEYVKRVIGLPGERLEIINKQVLIDGLPLDEPYTVFKDPNIEGQHSPRDNLPGTLIPENHYFCMGDNRDHSYDSRYWGPVNRDLMIGKPWRIYWSFKASTAEYLSRGFGYRLKRAYKTLTHFFSRTRWSRTAIKIE